MGEERGCREVAMTEKTPNCVSWMESEQNVSEDQPCWDLVPNAEFWPGMVAHACGPSYLGGGGRKIEVQSQPGS
jgi:hypothetical protein